MRLWHLLFAVWMVAVALTIARDPTGRVALVVFFTGLGEFLLGTTAVMALFRAVGAIGEAEGLLEHARAVLATALVILAASLTMNGWLWLGANLVQRAVE
ncbi:MAG: hypothetical protein IRY99_08460 [Isosphaeraceae bacterium]|nr:hypothetical protein [Isosphaeraceae bacterium]